jgi:hypothetical protein
VTVPYKGSARRVHPSWDEIKGFMDADDPTLHPIDGTPPVSIFLDPRGPRIGLRTPLPEGDVAGVHPLAEIEIRVTSFHSKRQLEVSTGNPGLFPYFFVFALSLADRIQLDGSDVRMALGDSLDRWRNLLRQSTMLSEEKQTGLAGEVWMLERLFASMGHSALDAWTGPRGEAHDFRVGNREFEVKTTRTERRMHSISSPTQLVPSPGRQLFLLSVQFAAAGTAGGASLADRVRAARSLFEPFGRSAEFDALVVTKYGISEATADHYHERLQLRSKPYLVPITPTFPSLREDDILAIPRDEMQRISRVQYSLDVSGLGFPDGSAEFGALLPEGKVAP